MLARISDLVSDFPVAAAFAGVVVEVGVGVVEAGEVAAGAADRAGPGAVHPGIPGIVIGREGVPAFLPDLPPRSGFRQGIGWADVVASSWNLLW